MRIYAGTDNDRFFEKLIGKDLWVSVVGSIPGTGNIGKYSYYIRILKFDPDTGYLIVNAINTVFSGDYSSREWFEWQCSRSYGADADDLQFGIISPDYFSNGYGDYQYDIQDILTTDELWEQIELNTSMIPEGV